MPATIVILIISMVVGFWAPAQTEAIDPRRFDVFGALGHCDLSARLDNFAIQLEHEAATVGNIVAFGPEGDGPGTGKFALKVIKDYLVDVRKLPKRRINTIYAGRNEVLYEPKIELWITPDGANAPEPPKFETNIETFKGLFFEKEAYDFIDITLREELMGPGIGLGTDAAFADMLQQQKKAIGYIVTFNGEDAVPGSARRVAAKRLEALKQHNVDLSRVKTIFGGVRKKTTFQLWITTPGEPPPVTDAGDERLPLKNALITSQGDHTLGIPANERAVFNRMLEVLRSQPLLKAVVIVKLEGKRPEPEPEPESPTPVTTSLPAPPETEVLEEEGDPPADLPKMVQKWREELSNTHKIRSDRFIVLFSTSRSVEGMSYGNSIAVWAVPPGKPLPEPNADEEEEPSDVVQDPKRRP